MMTPERLAATRGANPRSIGIVGGGASGLMLAIHLLRNAKTPLDLRIYETSPELGGGVAYGTRKSSHLMNGPVPAYSLYPDEPLHFEAWFVQNANLLLGVDVHGHDPWQLYSPRHMYADYLRAELARVLERSAQHSFHHVRARVEALTPAAAGYALRLDDGAVASVQYAVLATGIFKHRPAFVVESTLGDRYTPDPWQSSGAPLPPDVENVAIIGSGLTMIDIVLDLERSHYRGRYSVFSRHGTIPIARQDKGSPRTERAVVRQDASVRELFRAYRHALTSEADASGTWQTLSTALTVEGCERWRTLSEPERRRFLRHVLPHWNQLVHRAPPASRQAIERLIKEGRLQLLPARILAVSPTAGGGVELRIQVRGAAHDTVAHADRVINCTGPGYRWSRDNEGALVRQLLDDGMVRPEALGLGIELAANQAVIGRHGDPWPGLFALGAPARGLLLEANSLRLLSRQAVELAATLLR